MSESSQGAVQTALTNDHGGFREGVTVEAVDDLTPDRGLREKALGFLAGGLREANGLLHRTQTEGVGATTRQELAREREYVADADTRTGKVLRAGQSGSQLVGVMLTITLAAAIGFVGTKVISEIGDSITEEDLSKLNAENQTVYQNSTESIGSGFADAMGLTDIVFLVLMFGVILGALLAFRARR